MTTTTTFEMRELVELIEGIINLETNYETKKDDAEFFKEKYKSTLEELHNLKTEYRDILTENHELKRELDRIRK